MDFIDPKEEMKKREFELRCTVEQVEVAFHDEAYGQDQSLQGGKLAVLLPYEGTERDMFMAAWYEDAVPRPNNAGGIVSKVELPAFIGHPINMHTLVRLNWPNKVCQKPHLQVMTYGVEKLFNAHPEITTVSIRVLQEAEADRLGLYQAVIRM